MFTAIWDSVYSLFLWAWNFSIPLGQGNISIQIVPVILGVFLCEFFIDLCFPVPRDMGGGDE